MMNLKVENPVIINWKDIRYTVEFEMNGQKLFIGTRWENEKCSFDDVIAHKGYSGVTTVPKCSYCGQSFEDHEICSEFYFNPVKTQIIVDQLVVQLKEQLKDLPFDFENPFKNTNRGPKVANMIKIARERGHKITAILDDYDGYVVSGSVIPPDHDDIELFEDDNMFFMKCQYNIVNVVDGSEETVTGEHDGGFLSLEGAAYIIPDELLDHGNQFADLEVEWKREKAIECMGELNPYKPRESTAYLLKSMLENNFPKKTVYEFLESWIDVDRLQSSTEIVNAFIDLMEEDSNE